MPFALCTPAIVYFVMLVLALLMAVIHKVSFVMVFAKLLFGLGWGWLLNFICSKGYANVAWLLVFLPYLLFLLVILLIIEIISKKIAKPTKSGSGSKSGSVPPQMYGQMQQQQQQQQYHYR